LILVFNERFEVKKIEYEQELIRYGDLKAHIANCVTGKTKGGDWWTYKDFVNVHQEKQPTDLATILTEAKQKLGSTFTLHAN
jgi:hypothetical protein